MHRAVPAHHPPTVGLGNGLVPQANPQSGYLRAETPDHVQGNPGLLRATGPRRKDYSLR